MYSNVAFDFVIGLVPVLGDLADVWYKCNTRNNVILERYLRERGQKFPASQPPAPKQSAGRRWFGSGSNAPRSNVAQPEATSTEVKIPPRNDAVNEHGQDLEAQNTDAMRYTRQE